jgi:hypothetical protein
MAEDARISYIPSRVWGLVNKPVPQDQLDVTALTRALRVASVSSSRLSTLLDGITRHISGGRWFRR